MKINPFPGYENHIASNLADKSSKEVQQRTRAQIEAMLSYQLIGNTFTNLCWLNSGRTEKLTQAGSQRIGKHRTEWLIGGGSNINALV